MARMLVDAGLPIDQRSWRDTPTAVRDPMGRAYNRTKYLEERTAMMQAWADYLDKLKAGAEIIPLRA